MARTFQLKISLNHSKPPIWRRILVGEYSTFYDLHLIIQYAMGWDDAHLWEFNVDGDTLSEKFTDEEDDDNFFGIDENKSLDPADTLLSDLITKVKEKFKYLYDFGDSWEHTITVEKIIEETGEQQLPYCLTGKYNCPPEDCGGIWGYYELMEILANPKHKEYKSMREWVGDYDADEFDLDLINKKLSMLAD